MPRPSAPFGVVPFEPLTDGAVAVPVPELERDAVPEPDVVMTVSEVAGTLVPTTGDERPVAETGTEAEGMALDPDTGSLAVARVSVLPVGAVPDTEAETVGTVAETEGTAIVSVVWMGGWSASEWERTGEVKGAYLLWGPLKRVAVVASQRRWSRRRRGRERRAWCWQALCLSGRRRRNVTEESG